MSIAVVTVTGTTTVFAPAVSTMPVLNPNETKSKAPTGSMAGISTKISTTHSSSATPTPSRLFTQATPSQLITSSSEIPPLPSGWPKPTPVPVDSKPIQQSHSSTLPIVLLVFLVLLGVLFVCSIAYIAIQKMRGNCANCKSLQETIDKYARGELPPITKKMCRERDSWFEDQGAQNTMEKRDSKDKGRTKGEAPWSFDSNSGAENEKSARVDSPLVLPPGYPYILSVDLSDKRVDQRASSRPSYTEPYLNVGMQNPYEIPGVPTCVKSPRKFATYDEHQNEAFRQGKFVQPDGSQSYMMERFSEGELAEQYRRACFDVGHAVGGAKAEAEARKDRLSGHLRRGTRAHDGFSSIAGPDRETDPEARQKRKPGGKSLLK